MTLTQKLRRSFKDRARYQRTRKAILEYKRNKNATNRHTRSLQRAIQDARAELAHLARAA